MSESIVDLVDRLPADNMTVKVLKALDFVVPGDWQNAVGFDNTIRQITGVTDAEKVRRIRDRAVSLYHDSRQPYQFAIRLYRTIDKADTALGTAALANKVGEKVNFLSFLNRITPKADTVQTIDLVLKVAVELIAYCKLNGLPQPNPSTFASSLKANYTDSALMRMGALVCIDGILPLGPNFLDKVHGIIDGADSSILERNPVFTAVSNFIPGEGSASKLAFVRSSFDAVQGWMESFVAKTGATPSSISRHLGSFIQIADDKLDFVGAFLDQTTNYYEHTGIQTVARSLILRAWEEVQQEQPQSQPAVAQASQSASIPPERLGTDGQFNQSGLAQRVTVAFKNDPQLAQQDKLWVAQTGTTVVLKGQVPNQGVLDRAVAIAQSEPGCTAVETNLVLVG